MVFRINPVEVLDGPVKMLEREASEASERFASIGVALGRPLREVDRNQSPFLGGTAYSLLAGDCHGRVERININTHVLLTTGLDSSFSRFPKVLMEGVNLRVVHRRRFVFVDDEGEGIAAGEILHERKIRY